ncbi:GNAT family N-acetyltransferase [Pseudomonas alliivorans]|nr:GNAT family N-acetyltransferase [Pseudomonas alliivorans]MEE4795596.1 GNAT family N-acetyltransferase [Pseudomonas alliivorans]MEE4800653.1 GNAT family N-acetyltransferase [Pseudomonas alliivorans]MEE4810745.1 GNAT family N-acetyltransferase [Pseudomonas alliivorans]MEE4814814.1 GNAT family N-acetyltransferase [Pseudomonas alliivorans]
MTPTDILIQRFESHHQQGVVDVILPIQREEFGIAITAEDQPDLKSIPDFYQSGTGDFWVATHGGQVIGTIGLKDIGAGQAALRKMFVAAPFRGREFSVAARLLDRLIQDARIKGVSEIFLGTTDKFLAAHRFYEKHGFSEVARENLPESFPLMAVDSKFYVLALSD